MPFSLTRFHCPPGVGDSHRAAALQAAIKKSPTEAVGWIDPGYAVSDEALRALCAALDAPGVAAATIAGRGQTLTLLGVLALPPLPGPPALPALPASPAPPALPAPVLFPPEGLAVFHRGRVLAAGGIDTTLVFGHEAANLGWRLALRGLRTVEVATEPKALSANAQTGSLDRRALATRLRHQTANELATLFVCAGDEWLRSALPCALARLLCLATADAGLAPEQFEFGLDIPATRPLPVESLARLLAIDDLIRHLPPLRKRRALEQRARTHADDEIRGLFAPDPVDAQWMNEAGDGAHALCRMLGVSGYRPSGTKSALQDRNVVRTFPPPPKAPARLTEASFGREGGRSAVSARVSIIVLTASGPKHLPDCLDSLRALDYPREATEVIVVDNGSAEDPTATIERHYPGARVIRNHHNLGFCGGNNVGVDAASHEWLFFLNDDTRVDAGVLGAVFDTAARRSAVSVGAFVVDWSGTHVDYAGGGVNFEAHGFQHGMGSAHPDRWKREQAVAFANGAAMLVRRDAYLAAGGFPNPYFAYYEDVALGWALWVQGYQVWLCPQAIVYHRHHGTSARSANAARQRNCERNACFTLLTHPSDELLPDLLGASLMLAAERIVMSVGLGGMVDDRLAFNDDHRLPVSGRLDPRLYVGHLRAELRRRGARREHGAIGSLSRVGMRGLVGAFGPLYRLARWGGALAPAITDAVDAPSDWVATLAALAEWCGRAGEMEPRRRAMQESRGAADRDVVQRFAENWLNAIPVEPARQAEYERAHRVVIKQFDLARFFRGNS